MEIVEATRKSIGNSKVVIIRPTFLMDESFYPANHDHTTTKDWVVIAYDEKDDKSPDPRTANGKDEVKVAKSRDDVKKAKKTHYWFDKFEDADKKYKELALSDCKKSEKDYLNLFINKK